MAVSRRVHQKIEWWLEHYARVGYAAKGVIYGVVGLLALFEAMDFKTGETVGSDGVLRRIAGQPFGRVLLVVLTVSLIGYVVWRFIQAAIDPEHNNSFKDGDKDSDWSWSDILRRISYACSGIAYLAVAYSAFETLDLASEDSGSGRALEDRALMIMQQPLGRVAVGIGGLIVCGIGCYYFYRAIKAEFRKRFKRHHMSDAAKIWATIAGRVGIAARGFVYLVIGGSALRAAWEFDPSMIKTTEGALSTFDDNPADEWILAVLGIGFMAYAVHMGFQARYRSIDPL